MTQQERILQRIKEVGYVDNWWAMNNGIWRLGARIHDLAEEGHEFVAVYGDKTTNYTEETQKKFRKVYHYIPTKHAQVKEGMVTIVRFTKEEMERMSGANWDEV